MRGKLPPLCRYCGKPIKKRTKVVQFGRDGDTMSEFWSYRPEMPRSLEEAQRLLNQQVVSVRWARGEEYSAKKAGFDWITQISTWDGESYDDPYFCNGEHAKRFAYAAANSGHAMPAYFEALRDQKARAAK